MKFLNDENPKKLRLQAETPAEEAWLRTLPQRSHRCRKGDEHYVLAAFRRWLNASGGTKAVEARAAAIDVTSLKEAMTSAPPPAAKPTRADRLHVAHARAIQAAHEWMDSDNGVLDASTRGRIIAAANELHQLRFGTSMEFAETQRELKAFEAYEFITGVAL